MISEGLVCGLWSAYYTSVIISVKITIKCIISFVVISCPIVVQVIISVKISIKCVISFVVIIIPLYVDCRVSMWIVDYGAVPIIPTNNISINQYSLVVMSCPSTDQVKPIINISVKCIVIIIPLYVDLNILYVNKHHHDNHSLH